MGFRTFKNFYCSFVCKYWRKEFPKLPSYNRFLELIKTAMLPLTLFSQFKSGKKTGVYYIDSTSLPACNLKRSHRNKVLKQVSDYGKTSVGWFFGMKLHLVINNVGELMAFSFTKGNKHDSSQAVTLLKNLTGIACGDKGYIGKKIFETLLESGLKLVTKFRKNMKNNENYSRFEKFNLI